MCVGRVGKGAGSSLCLLTQHTPTTSFPTQSHVNTAPTRQIAAPALPRHAHAPLHQSPYTHPP